MKYAILLNIVTNDESGPADSEHLGVFTDMDALGEAMTSCEVAIGAYLSLHLLPLNAKDAPSLPQIGYPNFTRLGIKTGNPLTNGLQAFAQAPPKAPVMEKSPDVIPFRVPTGLSRKKLPYGYGDEVITNREVKGDDTNPEFPPAAPIEAGRRGKVVSCDGIFAVVQWKNGSQSAIPMEFLEIDIPF